MGAIEFLANRPQLTLLELADAEAAPPVGRADDGRVHELQHWALPEGVRDNLRATSLLEEQPFEQVRGADDAPMAEREASANASQSSCDPSFIAEGETDGFTHRALPQRSRTNPAD